MQTTIGKKLQQLRKHQGLSQQEIATKLNVSRQTIGKWESDLSLPDIESLVKISELFNVSINEIIGIEKNEHERIPVTYEQIQAVLTNLQKENKMRNIYQIIMMIVCVVSLGLMVSMKFDLNTQNKTIEIHEYERPTQQMFFNSYSGHVIDSELFVRDKSHTNISQFNFDKCVVTLDYQLTLREATSNTTMSIEFTEYEKTSTYNFEKLDNNTFTLNQTIPIKIYDSILLKINRDDQTIIEDITHKNDTFYHEMYLENTAHFYVPANSLNTIEYAPHEFPGTKVIGYPKGTFSLSLYNENYELIHEETSIPMDTPKTITLDTPLKANEKVYVALDYSMNLSGSITDGSYATYYGNYDGTTVLCTYFIITNPSMDYTICGYQAP